MDYDLLDVDYFNLSLWNISNSSGSWDFSPSGWCEAGRQESVIQKFQTSALCLIFPLGLLGNGLVIATFVLYRRLRLRSLTDVFLFHLALADLLLLLTLPLQVVETNLGWIFSVGLCKSMRAGCAVNTYSGLLLLACIGVDRYLVVAHAQEMLRLRRQILAGGKLAAVGVWAAALLLSLPEILFSGVTGSGADAYCGTLRSGAVKMAANGSVVAVCCLSFLVMTTCYTLIARALWGGGARRRGQQWRRQRTLKLMVALVLAFVLFQLPYTAVLWRKMSGPFCGLLLEYVTCTLAYARCCLNPVLYALVGVRFRSDVLKLVHDAGCSCGRLLTAPKASATSLSSPAACSPTPPPRSSSCNETSKFPFSADR